MAVPRPTQAIQPRDADHVIQPTGVVRLSVRRVKTENAWTEAGQWLNLAADQIWSERRGSRSVGFHWQGHHSLNATFAAVVQCYSAAMGLNGGPVDGETQADAARIAAAGSPLAHEGFKDRLKLIFGQAPCLRF